jgi:hypothetical protein
LLSTRIKTQRRIKNKKEKRLEDSLSWVMTHVVGIGNKKKFIFSPKKKNSNGKKNYAVTSVIQID